MKKNKINCYESTLGDDNKPVIVLRVGVHSVTIQRSDLRFIINLLETLERDTANK